MKLLLNHRVRLLPVVALTVAAFNLAACSKPPPPTPLTKVAVTTQLSAKDQQRLLTKLRQQQVQIIQQGSRLQLILPQDKFFATQTTQVKSGKTMTLRLVALYLHNYTRQHHTAYPIKIYSYSDKVFNRKDRRARTNQFAQVVGAFMWSHGFTPTQMSVIGFGAKKPIGNNRTSDGSAFNRRVMIQVN